MLDGLKAFAKGKMKAALLRKPLQLLIYWVDILIEILTTVPLEQLALPNGFLCHTRLLRHRHLVFYFLNRLHDALSSGGHLFAYVSQEPPLFAQLCLFVFLA